MKAADNSLKAISEWFVKSIKEVYDDREAVSITRLVIQEIFGLDRSEQIMQENMRLSESDILKLVRIKERLLKNEPVQYILGKAHFRGMDLMVDSSVLIPRPETEELVDSILKSEDRKHLKVLDIGTGSGCIALALKKKSYSWDVHAWDISEEAVAIARKNSEQLAIPIELDKQDALHPPKDLKWDIIVSNPPYIARNEAGSMLDNVLEFEPELALFVADEEPLVFYRAIIEYAVESLNPGGSLWFEVHEDRAQDVIGLIDGEHWSSAEVIFDLQQKERIVHARKKKLNH